MWWLIVVALVVIIIIAIVVRSKRLATRKKEYEKEQRQKHEEKEFRRRLKPGVSFKAIGGLYDPPGKTINGVVIKIVDSKTIEARYKGKQIRLPIERILEIDD